MLRRYRTTTVYGVRARPPRPTALGLALLAAVFGPPAFLFILALDILFGVIAVTGFGVDVSLLGLFL